MGGNADLQKDSPSNVFGVAVVGGIHCTRTAKLAMPTYQENKATNETILVNKTYKIARTHARMPACPPASPDLQEQLQDTELPNYLATCFQRGAGGMGRRPLYNNLAAIWLAKHI